MASTFSAGGLASGLDTQSIIDGFVRIEQQPVTALQTAQAAVKSQISLVGDISSKLSAFDTAAQAIGTSGLLAISVQGHPATFAAQVQPGASEGEFDIQVHALASAAKARSQAYSAVDAQMAGGTLHFSVNGKSTDVTIADGAKLNDVASQINSSGAGVSANVIWDGTNAYLTFVNQSTGYSGATADTALGITFSQTGSTGQAIAATVTHAATNASFDVDGLTLTRQSNTVSDAIKGVTLTLQSAGSVEALTLARDTSTAQARMQSFADAYNAVASAIAAQVDRPAGSSRQGTLASDGSLRDLRTRMQDLLSSTIGSGGVRSLADLGVHTQKDGSITLDAATLTAAIARDPQAADQLFSTANTGAAALVHSLVKSETDPVKGLLVAETSSMNDQLKSMDAQIARMQIHVAAYRQQLVDQFSAMETIVSGLKSTGDYLNSLSNASSGTGK